ncbi:hypothetical protein B0H94_10337 [Salsuginibacillus halophilus]|uniref:Uncharacterized protein n=1 Tax=Salsuginibacillus halophilus TaxID=517424 RepID=A0A2P8HW36_9BACI|nr:hypothetical protein [Salsuginibacillus halophilus]PSL50426.1 hypothetical protein B0H94_10337 [Salsuginibacillus halophilus]
MSTNETTNQSSVYGKTMRAFDQFHAGQTVYLEEKECSIIAEYERSIAIEFVDFPFPEETERFPHARTVVKKEKVQIIEH